MPRTPGTKPIPTERKRMRGNPGKRPLPEPKVLLPCIEKIPEPLRPLGTAGRELWERSWNAAARWVSPDTDVELLQMLCEMADERVILRTRVLRDADDYLLRQSLRALDAQLIHMLSLLGFTPVDRSRLGIAEVVAQSTLAKIREQRGQAS